MNMILRLVAEHRAVLTTLRPRPTTDVHELLEPTARAVLGMLAEPGDGVLGRAVSALGAVGHGRSAARALLAASSSSRPSARAGELIEPKDADDGLKRWTPRIDDGVVHAIDRAGRACRREIPDSERRATGRPDSMNSAGTHRSGCGCAGGSTHSRAVRRRSPSSVRGRDRATASTSQVRRRRGSSDRGFVVVSGGAYGIDGMAHRAALASDGTTVAFLAGGVDRFYPIGHESLLTRIASSSGAVISEVPCGTAPTKWRFLERNRLIAAASDATVVLEAGLRSGSLNTAGHASALGRPLGAVPGPVTSPASAGCHRLFREYDAVCVVDAAQMAELAVGSAVADPRRARSRVERGGRDARRPAGARRTQHANPARARRDRAAQRRGLLAGDVGARRTRGRRRRGAARGALAAQAHRVTGRRTRDPSARAPRAGASVARPSLTGGGRDGASTTRQVSGGESR